MVSKKINNTLIICVLIVFQFSASAAKYDFSGIRKSKNRAAVKDSISWSISLMKKVFNGSGEWYLTNDSFQKAVKGVIDYAENDPLDTVVIRMNQLLKDGSIPLIFNRKAESIPDKKIIPGFLSAEEVDRLVEHRRKSVADSIRKTLIQVPDSYISQGLTEVQVIPAGDPKQMLITMDKLMPVPFRNKFNKGWERVILPAKATETEIDTLKIRLFNLTRQLYNDSILFSRRDSLILLYRNNVISQQATEASLREKNFLYARNRDLLGAFNEEEVTKMNDSIRHALGFLTYLAASDSTLLTVANLKGGQAKIWTANHPMTPMRLFLKNEQNDSLSVILYNNGKDGLKIVIDDGVKFLRFTETQKKEITFNPKKPDGSLHKVILRTIDPLPWKLLGFGTIGFTQTALSNWAKGGESSLSMLLIERYTANYTKKNLSWENFAEFRFGTFSSKSRGLEKNEDKLEFQSRFGYSAFKKWYYSCESNFRTQLTRGYAYPDKVNPISAFMAPGYLTFSVGLDYKPNKNFSLFLSPITSKTTFVKDTALINPSHYGLDPGKTRLWEPGAIAKVNWHYKIKDDVFYDTRAEVFNNYNFPFQKFNVNWEQTLAMQLTQHINTRINTQVIYDYNVKFPDTDANGNVISLKAKWQLQEMFTLGINYKF